MKKTLILVSLAAASISSFAGSVDFTIQNTSASPVTVLEGVPNAPAAHIWKLTKYEPKFTSIATNNKNALVLYYNKKYHAQTLINGSTDCTVSYANTYGGTLKVTC